MARRRLNQNKGRRPVAVGEPEIDQAVEDDQYSRLKEREAKIAMKRIDPAVQAALDARSEEIKSEGQ